MRSRRQENLDTTGCPARLLRGGTVSQGGEYAGAPRGFRPACRERSLASARRPRLLSGALPTRADDPRDTGWHVDLSFPGPSDDPNERDDFSAWRVNVTSRG